MEGGRGGGDESDQTQKIQTVFCTTFLFLKAERFVMMNEIFITLFSFLPRILTWVIWTFMQLEELCSKKEWNEKFPKLKREVALWESGNQILSVKYGTVLQEVPVGSTQNTF
jgi:hypothetical protein